MSAAGKDHLAAADPALPVDRIPLYEVYMRMAEELAKRSTCVRLQVGTVVTDQRLENVLAIGYNGNARGLPNKCDSAVPGKDRKSTRLNSSHRCISYAVFCLK